MNRFAWPFTALVAAGLFIAGESLAFKLRPSATSTENRVRYLQQGRFGTLLDNVAQWVTGHFTSPVHEEITDRIWGCQNAATSDCQSLSSSPYRYAPPAVLFGVQWNDNPPFALTATRTKSCPVNETIRLPNYSECWITLFKDAAKHASQGAHFDYRGDMALLYRVHFGDMQFLHAMASWDGESMSDTKARILTWAELAYRTAIGDISPVTPVSNVPVKGIPRLFKNKGYSVKNLFTRGVPEFQSQVDQVALGSLMHVVEDSFAQGHLERDEPTGEDCPAYPGIKRAGRVLAFHSFATQDARKHDKADSREAFEAHLISKIPNVVDVGRALKALYDARKPWTDVRPFLDECVFEVAEDDLDQPAGPGGNFERQ
jgi:hypothetical protein